MSDIFTLREFKNIPTALTRYPVKVSNKSIVLNSENEPVIRLENNSANAIELFYNDDNSKAGLRLFVNGRIVNLANWDTDTGTGGISDDDINCNTISSVNTGFVDFLDKVKLSVLDLDNNIQNVLVWDDQTNEVKYRDSLPNTFNKIITDKIESTFNINRNIEFVDGGAFDDILIFSFPRTVLGGHLDFPSIVDPGTSGLSSNGGRLWSNFGPNSSILWKTLNDEVDLTNPYSQDLSTSGSPTFDTVFTKNLHRNGQRYINCDGSFSAKNLEFQPALSVGQFDDPSSIGSVYIKPGDRGLHYFFGPVPDNEMLLSWGIEKRELFIQGPFSTTSIGFINVNPPITYTPMLRGKYLIKWYLEASNDNRNSGTLIRVILGQVGIGNTFLTNISTPRLVQDNDYISQTGFSIFDNVNEVQTTIGFQYAAENDTARVRNLRMLIYRIE